MEILKSLKIFLYPRFKKEEDAIKINRVYCFFSIPLVPVFVLTVFPYEIDRLLLDVSLFIYLTAILILSYSSSFVKNHFSLFLFIGFLFVTFNVLFINYKEVFELKSFLGLITIIFAIGLVVQNHKYSFYYSIITLIMTIMTLYLVDKNYNLEEPMSFYIGIIFFISLVSFYVTRFRSITTKQLVYNVSLLRSVFQDSPDALFLLNKQSNIIEDVNNSVTKMFAIKNKVRLLGKDYLYFSKKYKVGKKFFQEEFINEEEWHKEIKYKNGNGDVLWVDQVVSNIISGDREYYLIRMTDITERKRVEKEKLRAELAEETARQLKIEITDRKEAENKLRIALKEKEVLLKEVHHRVKNNLQVISSILNLQTSYVSDESILSILKECQNRIKTMSFIHESLYQSKDLSDVSFDSYIKNLCGNLHYSYMTRDRAIDMCFDIEEVFLKLDTAIPCGLIINELVSNAFKHAFTGRDKGELLVSLKAVGGNEFILVVKDNGKGLQEDFKIEQSDSLGLQLVVTLVDQIRGEIDIESDDGLKYTIKFKDIYKDKDVKH